MGIIDEERKTISPDVIEKVYNLGKQVFANEISFDDALDCLEKNKIMNKKSADGYLKNYFCMRNRENFHWTMNKYAYRYYLDNIYKDNGKEGLKLALCSYRQHLDSNQNFVGKLENFEAIYTDFEKLI